MHEYPNSFGSTQSQKVPLKQIMKGNDTFRIFLLS